MEKKNETVIPVYNYTVPTFTIAANSGSKDYDGTALTNNSYNTGYTEFPLRDSNESGTWSLASVGVEGSVTTPSQGDAANVVTSFTLVYTPDDQNLAPLTFSYADGVIDEALEGKVSLESGTLRVTPLTVTVTPVSGTVETHGETVTAAD